MNKNILLLLLIPLMLWAERVVLVEIPNELYCLPCNKVAHICYDLVTEQPDKIITVAQHYLYKPPYELLGNEHGLWRSKYLEIRTRVPAFNGDHLIECDPIANVSNPIGYDVVKDTLRKVLDSVYTAEDELFQFTISTEYDGSSDSCSIEASITALESSESNQHLKAYLMLAEDTVDYATLCPKHPWKIKNLHYILRDILPRTESDYGVNIGAIESGDEFAVKATYTRVGNIRDKEQMRVIVVVEDTVTKHVLGAYKSDLHPFQNHDPVAISSTQKKANVSSSFTLHRTEENGLQLTVSKSGRYKATLFTASGRVLKDIDRSYYGVGKHTLLSNTSAIGTSIFFVRVEGASESKTLKFCVTK